MIRVLLADDHQLFREGLKRLLESERDMQVLAEANNGLDVQRMVEELKPDVVLMDVSMAIIDGISATREIARRWPDTKVVILSMHAEEGHLFQALQAGAAGYVLKSAADHDLVEACRAAMRGQPFLYPDALAALIRDYLDRLGRGESAPTDPLTPRELEIVKLVAEGHTSDEIADTLVISKKTVEHHRSHILEKLGMRDRVELTRYAIRRGLVEP